MRWPRKRRIADRDPSPAQQLREMSNETRDLAARLLQMSKDLRRQEGLPK